MSQLLNILHFDNIYNEVHELYIHTHIYNEVKYIIIIIINEYYTDIFTIK